MKHAAACITPHLQSTGQILPCSCIHSIDIAACLTIENTGELQINHACIVADVIAVGTWVQDRANTQDLVKHQLVMVAVVCMLNTPRKECARLA